MISYKNDTKGSPSSSFKCEVLHFILRANNLTKLEHFLIKCSQIGSQIKSLNDEIHEIERVVACDTFIGSMKIEIEKKFLISLFIVAFQLFFF